eukprot:scaffold12837_cov66-Phaeocystis_antarctica.AAC.5
MASQRDAVGSCAQCAVGYYKEDIKTGERGRTFEKPPWPTGKGAQPLPKRLYALGSRPQRRAAPVRVSPDRCTVCGNCGDGERRTACGGINGDDSDPVPADTATAAFNPREALSRPARSEACRRRCPALAHALCHCQARASAGQCTACDKGKYKAGDNTEDCSFCPAGKYSGEGATVCTNCTMPSDADEFDLKCVDRSLRAPEAYLPPLPPLPPPPPLLPPSPPLLPMTVSGLGCAVYPPTTAFDFSSTTSPGWSNGGGFPPYAFTKTGGRTPSYNTGPSAGVDGSGPYFYAEASSPR